MASIPAVEAAEVIENTAQPAALKGGAVGYPPRYARRRPVNSALAIAREHNA
jgi:hypothetical protein